LIHGIDNKGNGDWQHDETINLLAHIGRISRKRQNGNGCTRQNNGNMHPSQKSTFVGKENFGFHLDGSLARFDHFLFCGSRSIFGSAGSKQFTKETSVVETLFFLKY
jgi:hypothetical protein